MTSVASRLSVTPSLRLFDIEMVEVLLQLGADVNGVNEDRCNALHFATQDGSLHIIGELPIISELPIIGALSHADSASAFRRRRSCSDYMGVLQILDSSGAH